MILNSLNKSAILLMLIGSVETIKIFKYLKLYEIQKIITAVIDINLVSQEEISDILSEFLLKYKDMSKCVFLDHTLYIKNLKNKFLNKKKSENFLKTIFDKKKFFHKIQELHNIPEKKIFSLLKNEHSYIITSILFFLDKKYSANVISYFKHEQQSKLIHLIASFTDLDESKMSELSCVISMILSEYKKISCRKKSLVTAVNILNSLNFKKSRKIIYGIMQDNPDLGDQILCCTFSFADFEYFTDDSIMQLIKVIDQYQITIALYHVKKEIKCKFFKYCKNLEENLLILESDNERYISHEVVENAQKLIVLTAKRLLKNRKISILL
ncbi:Flagellar motor switch protein FliG [Buchnera aphidicola (Takecallis arundicolens)]|uniref:FliG C-terminal domain-containing protein n=1 Tax=Buchnera aphidicola TaxID=9 RepID=UPI0034644035